MIKDMILGHIFPLGVLTLLLNLVGTVQAGSIKGQATWYHDGIGACGGWNVDTDYIVALPPFEYAGGTKCGRQIKVSYQGKSVIAKVVDLCPSCGWSGIDLSPSAFQAIAPLDQGLIQVTWEYV